MGVPDDRRIVEQDPVRPVTGARRRPQRDHPAAGVLARWDRHNQDWATTSIRDPERRTGVTAIVVVGVLWAVATGVAVVLGEWLVAGVAAVKAQVFLMISLVVWHRARRQRPGHVGAGHQERP